jgi:membrane-associated phospholipid phosphatase
VTAVSSLNNLRGRRLLGAAGLTLLSVAARTAEAQTEPVHAAPQGSRIEHGDSGESATAPKPRPFDSYTFAPGEVCPFCGVTPAWPEGQKGLHWHQHWASVGTREYVTIPLLLGATLAFQALVSTERDADWNSPILFDSGVRDALRLNSPGARKTARDVSDALFTISYVQPVLIDNLIVTWGIRQSPRVAWQMFVINAQAYALTYSLNSASKRLTSRARPWVEGCQNDPTGESCGSGGAYSSFYSGHAAFTATGAGLVCAHHTQLSLYRNPYLDTGACAVAVLGTAVTGAMRIASDNHWASDVVIGHLAGYASGYLLPTLLYYKQFRLIPHDEHPGEPPPPSFAVLPLLGPDSAQVLIIGLL